MIFLRMAYKGIDFHLFFTYSLREIEQGRPTRNSEFRPCISLGGFNSVRLGERGDAFRNI
jgi:hypothetical protein